MSTFFQLLHGFPGSFLEAFGSRRQYLPVDLGYLEVSILSSPGRETKRIPPLRAVERYRTPRR
jgi:hypothetical protein